MPGLVETTAGMEPAKIAEFRNALELFKPRPFPEEVAVASVESISETAQTPPHLGSSSPQPEMPPSPKRARLSSPVLPAAHADLGDRSRDVASFDDPRLDEFFRAIAAEGATHMRWADMKDAFLWKLESVCRAMLSLARVDTRRLAPKNIHHVDGPDFLHALLASARALHGTPFTIQRLAELLTRPLTHYTRWDKFFRALEKTLIVVTTVNPDGVKEATHIPTNLDDTARLSSEDSAAAAEPPRLITPSSSSDSDTLVLGNDGPADDGPAPIGDSTNARTTADDEPEEREERSGELDLPSLDDDRPRTPEPPRELLPFLPDQRPNVTVSVQPVSKHKDDAEDPADPKATTDAMEITVEVEECGEVKGDVKSEEPPSL